MSLFLFIEQPSSIHRKVYLGGLVLLAISIPVSTFGMSISQIILLINWIWEGGFRRKWQQFTTNPAIYVFLIFYLVHLLGLFYTTWPGGFYGPGYNAADDLRIKLPLLLLPLIIGTSGSLNAKQIKGILYFFSISLFISSLISTWIFLGLAGYEVNDVRNISVFISHIRFSLLVNVAIFSFAYFFWSDFKSLSKYERLILPAGILWFIFFLFILKAFTGIFVFVIVLILTILWWINHIKKHGIRWAIYLGVLAPILLGGGFALFRFVDTYTDFDAYKPEELEKLTVNGRPYTHDFKDLQVENGHWVGLYIQKEELRRTWNERSLMDFDGKDQRGNFLYQTLSRYLTAMDLRKDSVGVSKLMDVDIRLIEMGYANPVYKKKLSLYPRLYEIVWELDLYFRGGNPSGHSVSQRIEFNRTGWLVFCKHPILGVGTGDVSHAYQDQYASMKSRLGSEYQKRSHNQYLTFLVAFGVVGLVILLFSMFFPVFYLRQWGNYLFVSAFAMALLSMLTEDTIETQAGVTFFVFFYSLFLFGTEKKHSKVLN